MLSFDSILVRLKGSYFSHKIKPSSGFRFHTGSIKRQHPRCCESQISSFDSILVRLKALEDAHLEGANLVSIPYWFD